MNKKIATVSSSVLLFALPLMTLAFNPGSTPIGNTGGGISTLIQAVLDFLWPVFMGFAVLMFLIAGFYFLTSQGDPGKVATARTFVLWAVVGVLVGILAFAIPFIIRSTLLNSGFGA